MAGWLLQLTVVVGMLNSGQTRRISDENDAENEVIKPGPIEPEEAPTDVPLTMLEAFYYEQYGGPPIEDSFERPGSATETDSCRDVRGVPDELRTTRHMYRYPVDFIYQKYTEAYGIPVIGSRAVSDSALRRACYVLRFLLADREDLRQAFYGGYGRVTVLGEHEVITDIPEYGRLPSYYNFAVRGLGAVPDAPASSGGEENLLCDLDDPNGGEDITLREVAMGIFELAARKVLPGFETELLRAYRHARASYSWSGTYAALTPESYLGEGVQSFFNANGYSQPPDGFHNEISSRVQLRTYDTDLFGLVYTLFPCVNSYLSRCDNPGQEPYQRLKMNCWPGTFGRHNRHLQTRRHRLRELLLS